METRANDHSEQRCSQGTYPSRLALTLLRLGITRGEFNAAMERGKGGLPPMGWAWVMLRSKVAASLWLNHGMSYSEIGDEMGMSYTAARAAVERWKGLTHGARATKPRRPR